MNMLLQSVDLRRHSERRDANEPFDEILSVCLCLLNSNGLVTNAAVRMSPRREGQAFICLMYVYET